MIVHIGTIWLVKGRDDWFRRNWEFASDEDKTFWSSHIPASLGIFPKNTFNHGIFSGSRAVRPTILPGRGHSLMMLRWQSRPVFVSVFFQYFYWYLYVNISRPILNRGHYPMLCSWQVERPANASWLSFRTSFIALLRSLDSFSKPLWLEDYILEATPLDRSFLSLLLQRQNPSDSVEANSWGRGVTALPLDAWWVAAEDSWCKVQLDCSLENPASGLRGECTPTPTEHRSSSSKQGWLTAAKLLLLLLMSRSSSSGEASKMSEDGCVATPLWWGGGA